MTFAELRTAIAEAAVAAVPGMHVYALEDTAALLDAIVIGWPSRIQLHADFGAGRDVEVPVLVLVGTQAGEEAALGRLQDLLDGPLVGSIESATRGAVLEVGQVSAISVAGSAALRVPFTLTTTI